MFGEGGLWLPLPVLAPPRPPPVLLGEGGLGADEEEPAWDPNPPAPRTVGEGGREGALVAATGEAVRLGRVLAAVMMSPTFGDGFLLADAPPLGDRCRLTLGEVGGVVRFTGGDGGVEVTLEEWTRLETPTPLRGMYRFEPGLIDRSLWSCRTGDDFGEDLGEVLGDDLGESLGGWFRVLLEARDARGSGEPPLLRWDPRGGGPDPTGDRTSLAWLALVGWETEEEEGAEEGCLATSGPFLVTPSPLPFLSLRRKLLASIRLSLELSPAVLLALAGEDLSPKLFIL